MAIIKDQKPNHPSPTLNDPPPSYHRLEPSSIRGSQRTTPALAPSSSPAPRTPAPKLISKKSKLKFADFLTVGKGQTVKDAKKMAYGSVLDVAKNPGAQGSTAVIETCAEVCQANGVNFSSILQDPCIEKHRALYWVIISGPPSDEYELLSAILKHSGKLSSEAIDEIRLACVQVGDQKLFNHFWRHPAYSALSRTDELLLGSATPSDRVEVQEATDDDIATFTTHLEIAQFHKRMNVSGKIVFEFIARGRLWCLNFHAAPDKRSSALGPWAISLSIISPSPPTWLDSRIIITEPKKKHSTKRHLGKGSAGLEPASSRVKREEPIEFLLQTKVHQLQPSTPKKPKNARTELVAYFAEDDAASRLQYTDSPYYSRDGSLQVTVEARLEKSETEQTCIIS
ncbi:hypothetical protein BJ322DRAFT_518412 [Thelephora terrestris]|uniref:Uncharacterized protein n=1 Tax=Thelephora terrestris TaxID=56493 RepID=A0A9P6H342_9AGAM|nr:hypothetical protein BJ322DRAFT_518412 [Thelephora terrestris]